VNGRCKAAIVLLVLCLLVLSSPASADYARAFAASGYGFSGFCFDPSLSSWGWSMPLSGWGWAWPTF
jgi:hypothetical protein